MMKTLLWIATFLLSTSVAAEARFRIERDSLEESIGASLIEDDGSAIIAIKNVEAKSARMLHLDAAGKVRTVPIPDMAVNHMKKLNDGSFFIGGARKRGQDAIYDFRIVRLSNGRYETAWEASSLFPNGFDVGSDLDVSPDGKRWAMVKEKKKGYRLIVGEVGKSAPLIDYDFTRETSTAPAVSSDSFGVEFVSASSATVAVMWSGRVHVYSGKQESPTLLVPDHGGGLTFDARRNILWVNGTTVISAFDLATLNETATGASSGIRPSRVVRFGNTTREIVPMRNGDFMLHRRVGSGAEVARASEAEPGNAPLRLATLPLHASVAVSPDGAATMLMSDGPSSDVVTIRRHTVPANR